MYEQVLINALEFICRQPKFAPAFDDPLGQYPFTVERCVKAAQDALDTYKELHSRHLNRMERTLICSIHNCHELPTLCVVIDLEGVIGQTIKVNLCREHEHLKDKITIKKSVC